MLNIQHQTLSATRVTYGEAGGEPLEKITLENAAIRVELINLGATITAIYAPDKAGVRKNIVAGFNDPQAYWQNPAYFGSTVGRYANRIAGGKLTIDGVNYQLPVNNDSNHLHGGFDGFHKKVWQVIQCSQNEEQASITMAYTSPDGEEAYPGTLSVQVRYILDRHNRLTITYTASTDKATPVSLTNHSYFNLTGFDNPLVTSHLLRINADNYTEKNNSNTPTGQLLPVTGTPLDFTHARPVGQCIDQLPADMGFDHNYVLRPYDAENIPAAELEDPESGRVLRIFTDQHGIQLYSANYWDGSIIGAQGVPYLKHGAVALETQAFPDSPNHAQFPETILRPGETYRRKTVFVFDVQ